MKTTITKQKNISREWHLIDLSDQTLGRSSTEIAKYLMGKDKTYFSPNLDCGDYVVVVNASKVKITGNKQKDKIYRHHTGFPGGFREYTFEQVFANDPTEIISHSVKGMLPKNKLRSERMKRLKVFVDEKHPYENKISSAKKD
jgi:large subunit ribosomal protein L13